jgi:hypothetical protein
MSGSDFDKASMMAQIGAHKEAHHTTAMGHQAHVPLSESTGPAGSLSDIREHLEVYASFGDLVGKVDRVVGDQIELTKADSPDGRHLLIPAA